MTDQAKAGPLLAALRACISEGRRPLAEEIEALAERIWNEAFRVSSGIEWHMLPTDSPQQRRAHSVARAALGLVPGRRLLHVVHA